MSALPAQVQREAEAADRMLQTLSGPPADPPSPPSEAEVPSVPAQATPPSPATATEAPKPDEGGWEQRYKTLQGMFQAETNRRDTRARELEVQLQQALSRISELEQATRKPSPAEPTQPLVTDKDVEAFGGDLIDLVKRQAQEVIQGAAREMEAKLSLKDAEIAKLREQLGGVAEQTKVVTQHTYIADLSKLVPDWEAVNTSQSFLDWLAQTDPLTGLQRQTYLDDAFGKLDVKRTAEIFNAFKGTKDSPKAQTSAPPSDLQRQVQPAPSAASPVAPSSDPGSKVWSVEEIDQFYRDVSRGAYIGKDKDVARLNAEIDLAISQGRLRA